MTVFVAANGFGPQLVPQLGSCRLNPRNSNASLAVRWFGYFPRGNRPNSRFVKIYSIPFLFDMAEVREPTDG